MTIALVTDRPSAPRGDALAPIRALLEDDSLTEIMVNGPDEVYIEREGRLQLTDRTFASLDDLVFAIESIADSVGRHIDRAHPTVDARLPDGSRVAASVAPVAVNGANLTIRKFRRTPLTASELVARGTFTDMAAEYLQASVLARLNIVVSGGTGSGKTTLLNVLSGFVPTTERIVTIEDAAELRLQQPHVRTLEASHGDPDGNGRVSIRDLVVHSLRMRPDRIVVGECRAGETLDMLAAMNTGHDGSMTTLHANSPRDCLSRLETMVMMAGLDLPLRAIRQQVAAAVDVIVQIARLRDGSRRVTSITELNGLSGDTIGLTDIFSPRRALQPGAPDPDELVPTGIRPRAVDELLATGLAMPPTLARAFPVWGRPAQLSA
jgi:pilus assembly protein CpaF